MTLFTTTIVATPSITLTTEASAIQRVRKYRQQRNKVYMMFCLPERMLCEPGQVKL
jgi:hypothetical protein